MTNNDSTPAATRYLIESLRTVSAVHPNHGMQSDHVLTAWVAVGDIEIETKYSYRIALEAWVGEQSTEPPLGAYRVIKHESFGSSLVEFELLETREREIRQIERAAPVSEIEGAVQS